MLSKKFSLGTAESRRNGGRASYDARRNDRDDIFARKIIYRPKKSAKLAEFLGIMIGDGSIGRYQVSIALNLKTDKEFSAYVIKFIKDLFKIDATLQTRTERNCVVVIVSSVDLADFLVSCGLPRGNKLKGNLDIPEWIKQSRLYSTACLRGIFDTDGGIFQEVHTYGTKKYAYMRMAFVSASQHLLGSIAYHLDDMGLHPKLRGDRRVTIERFTDVNEYFRMVGSSNPKHIHRFTIFGGVG